MSSEDYDEVMRIMLRMSAQESGVEFDDESYVPEAQTPFPAARAPVTQTTARVPVTQHNYNEWVVPEDIVPGGIMQDRSDVDYRASAIASTRHFEENFVAEDDWEEQNQAQQPAIDGGWQPAPIGNGWNDRDDEWERWEDFPDQSFGNAKFSDYQQPGISFEEQLKIIEDRSVREEQDREMAAMLAEAAERRRLEEEAALIERQRLEQEREEALAAEAQRLQEEEILVQQRARLALNSTLEYDPTSDLYKLRIRLPNNSVVTHDFSGYELVGRMINFIRFKNNIDEPISLYSYPMIYLDPKLRLRDVNLASKRETLIAALDD